jgi:hypothetical protein
VHAFRQTPQHLPTAPPIIHKAHASTSFIHTTLKAHLSTSAPFLETQSLRPSELLLVSSSWQKNSQHTGTCFYMRNAISPALSLHCSTSTPAIMRARGPRGLQLCEINDIIVAILVIRARLPGPIACSDGVSRPSGTRQSGRSEQLQDCAVLSRHLYACNRRTQYKVQVVVDVPASRAS